MVHGLLEGGDMEIGNRKRPSGDEGGKAFDPGPSLLEWNHRNTLAECLQVSPIFEVRRIVG